MTASLTEGARETPSGHGGRADRRRAGRRVVTLIASVTGAVVVALDGTVLTVVQPSLRRDLHASFAQVQWTSTGYLITVASLLVFAGRLGDRYGHRRVFALGILGFAVTSAGIGCAHDVRWVIGLRVAQGVFGALLQPATLGMLRAAYPPERLGMPIALRTSAIGLAAAAGPVVGGALAAWLGWRAVFFLNVPPAVAVGLLVLVAGRTPTGEGSGAEAPRTAEAPRADQASDRRRLDLPGAALLAVALVCLVHTLVAVPGAGWTPSAWLGLAGCGLAGTAFVWHERRAAHPLVPPELVRARPVAAALALLLAVSATLFGTLFVATYYLQDVLGLSPLECGIRTLPMAAAMVLGAPLCPVLARRFGPRRTAAVGAALVAVGVLTLSRLGEEAGAVGIGGAFLALGAGFVTVMVTATAVIVRRAPVAHAGVAGGLQQTALNIGPTLGVALATMLMTVATPPTRASADAFLSAMPPTLTALTGAAGAGLLLCAGLPGRTRAGHKGEGDDARERGGG
ncbi:MFS transporter [Streptomyces sp. NBC_01187]|uniref:MFS transporter n=1 Tax=Streptomyces sp. NBC_01187 TaxID=2903766 RepID=UPI00386A7ADF